MLTLKRTLIHLNKPKSAASNFSR